MNTDKSDKNQTKISKAQAAIVYGGLFAFGAGYNALVSRLEAEGWDEGYTSDLVVGGVLVTLTAAVPVVGWRNAAAVLLAFVASGLPMSIGAKLRYRKARQRERGYVIDKREKGTGAAAWNEPTAKARRGYVGVTGRLDATEPR